MRLFVAVYPSADAVADLAPVAARLGVVRAGDGVERPELWHLTVAFLGAVPDDQLPAVATAVADAAAVARPGALRVAGGGVFGARVLWAGLAGDLDALADLARQVRREVGRTGVQLDGRPFRPHLTLARLKGTVDTAALGRDLAALATYVGPSWPMADVHLVRSHGGSGVRYETMRSWPLGVSS
ncbi:MAG TPA: RNA 2',3'-cyclic phosphodiesterase [Cryptosporangiaceae bacterium]|nr:RNA 2',3'-cyclic phosphodiesterase [Cryptosporangiaceae bacterium]